MTTLATGMTVEQHFRIRHAREPILLPSDVTVIAATDSRQFVGMQFLYWSLQASHRATLHVIDLGMSGAQRAWCNKQPGLAVDTCRLPLIFEAPETYWQTWSKPLYLQQYTSTIKIGLDVDTVVVGSLLPLISATRDRFTIIKDYHCPGREAIVANKPEIYKVIKPLTRLTCMPNAGVLGLVQGRDDQLVKTWIDNCRMARQSIAVKRAISWWDQGALILAMERLGMGDDAVTCERRWNECGGRRAFPDVETFVTTGCKLDAEIIHFTGGTKPWATWSPDVFDNLLGEA